MRYSRRINLISVIFSLSIIMVTNMQYQNQYALGQNATTNATSASSTTEHFSSQFDTFVSSEPAGFGMYDKKRSNVFAPGETFLLYVEPVGYSYGNTTDERGRQLYTMSFTADINISRPDGSIVFEQEDLPLSNLVSHHQNKELMLQMSLDQTSPFPPGNYTIAYTFTDENSGNSFDILKNVTVSGDAVQPSPITDQQLGSQPGSQQEISNSLVESSKASPDKAFLFINSNTGWSATVLDSGGDSFTQDGSGDSSIGFECIPGFMSSYSISVQKQEETGFLSIAIIQNGNILDRGETTAAYGIASLSGNCNEPG